MRWSLRKLLLACLIRPLSTLAQTPPSSNVAQCIPQYDWSISSSGQTPCLLAAFLESACGQNTSVNALPVGAEYQGPTSSEQSPCKCSSVTYILMSACAGCQDRQFVNWTTWCGHCDNLFREIFPKPLPPFIDIPPWAFMNVTVEGAFNPDLAAAIALNTTAPSSIISSSTPTASTNSPSSTTTSDGTTPSAQTTMAKKRVGLGPIIGGVVGGSVVVIFAVALVWQFCCRRTKQQPVAEPIDPSYDVVVPFVSSPSSDGFGTPSSSPQALLFDHQRIAAGAPTSKYNRSRVQTTYRPATITESEKDDPPPQYNI